MCFHLLGTENKQNVYTGPIHKSPAPTHASSSQSTCNCLVCCGKFWDHRPLLLKGEGQTVTVTPAQYTVMLQEFLAPELHHQGITLNAVCTSRMEQQPTLPEHP